MKIKINKYLLLITGILIILISIFAYTKYINSDSGIYNSLKKISTDNGWSKQEEYYKCDTTSKCIIFAYSTIKFGVINKLIAVDASDPKIEERLTSIENLFKINQLKEGLKQTEILIKEINIIYDTKKPIDKELKQKINEALCDSPLKNKFSILKFREVDDWVAVIIKPTVKGNDNGLVVLKRESSKWRVIDGPSTYINPYDLEISGAPKKLIRAIEDGLIYEVGYY